MSLCCVWFRDRGGIVSCCVKGKCSTVLCLGAEMGCIMSLCCVQ